MSPKTLTFQSKQTPVPFELVTSWELMEHIAEEKIEVVASNIKKHGVNLHQTVQPKEWWIKKFEGLGLYHQAAFVDFFNTQFVRGGTKYSGAASGSFHLVLSAAPQHAPQIPPLGIRDKLFDAWLGSTWQKTLKRWVIGPAPKYS